MAGQRQSEGYRTRIVNLTLSSRTRSGIQEVLKSWIAGQARNDDVFLF